MSPVLRALTVGSAVAVLLAAGGAAAASSVAPQVVVGIPGCTDDVPVRASREAITFQSRDRPIRALLYTPRGEANGRGVVMLHGGTGFEMNSVLFDAHAIQLASRGYWVMLPAYFDAAAAGRGRTVAARAWRQVAIDAARALEQRPGVAAGQVAFWGYSRGAGVAADAVTDPASPVNAAILAAGGGGVDEALQRTGVSVLLLHARRDELVPVRSTLNLADDLKRAGAAVEVQSLDFDGHQYDLPTWCAVMQRTRNFLETPGGQSDGPA